MAAMPDPAALPARAALGPSATRCRWRLWMLALAALPASAQTLYRCGNTYSQTPCAAEAQAVRVYAASAPKSAPGPRGFALCAAQLPEAQAARAKPEGPRRTEVIAYAGQPMQARRFDLTVPAEGADPATLRLICWLSEDEARVLQVERR